MSKKNQRQNDERQVLLTGNLNMSGKIHGTKMNQKNNAYQEEREKVSFISPGK